MDYLYLDCENLMDKPNGFSLGALPLRTYLRDATTTALAYAVNDDPVTVIYDPEEDFTFIEQLREALLDEDVCLVAHEWSYDARVLVHRFGLPYPCHGHCTIDLAHAAWPQQPGGYGAAALAHVPAVANILHRRGAAPDKLSIDLNTGCYTHEALHSYVAQDVEICRAVHEAACARVSELEMRIEETTTRFRQLALRIDQERLAAAATQFNAQALEGMREAIEILGADSEEAFGFDGENIKSVKQTPLRQYLLEVCAFDTPTISLKKISSAKLSKNRLASRVLHGSSRANRMRWHRQNVSKLAGVLEVDCELANFRSHTGRSSSPAVGKGINLLNLPKHDKTVARPIRESYRFPEGMCAVRADASNLEYRMGVLMTGCEHGIQLFGNDPFADPYLAFWYDSTRRTISRSDPERQMPKMAVLALEYLMSAGAWCGHLARELAKPYTKLREENLIQIADDQGWRYAQVDKWTRARGTQLGLSQGLVAVGWHTHRIFHEVHPEFLAFAKWVLRAIKAIVGAPASYREWVCEEKIWQFRNAPDRQWFDMHLDPELEGVSLAVTVGRWSRTVVWRDLGVRDTPYGYNMTCLQAGNKGYRALTKNLVIENPCQSLGRNAVAACKLALEARGHQYIGDVHDEILTVVPRTREHVLRAHQDLMETGGPGNSLGYGWAFQLDANEVLCSESWYSDDMGKLLPEIAPGKHPHNTEWWERLRDGDDSLLETLW
jgi:hypothetical protein